MSEVKTYVRLDEQGVLRVGNGRVMFDSIVAGFEQGHSPETIRQQYPALTLGEVYGAITWYLAHRDEARAYLQRQGALWEQGRAKSREKPSPVVERLRALRHAEVSEAS
jgi:uncharacterized protein (DUF433 family)